MNWLSMLPKMARFGPPQITVAVTEKTARKRLKLKKTAPIVWHGIPLRCIGSANWRRRIWEIRNLEVTGEGVKCAGCGGAREGTKAVCLHCLRLANAMDDPHKDIGPEVRVVEL